LWLARYKGPANGDDTAYALGVSPDNSVVFVTGGSTGTTTGQDYATGAYDAATGVRLWGARYNGSGNSDDAARALGVSPDGSAVFVTGSSYGATTGQDYATIAYDAATGALLWGARYNGPGNGTDLAYDLAVSPDGSAVFVTGQSLVTDFDYATIAYDAVTGDRLWVARYKGPGRGFWDIAYALGVSPDGSSVFVTGASTEPGGSTYMDYQTVAYDAATGARLWGARYDSHSSDDLAYALAVSPDGSAVFVTGYRSVSETDYFTIAYDTVTGARLWSASFDGNNNTDVAYALAVSPDGSTVFVTGRTGEYGFADYATVAYDAATGRPLWQAGYDGPENDEDVALALGVSPDGSTVYVTGESGLTNSTHDYATAAYDAVTGAELWVDRYNGPPNGDDIARALGVSPDGSALFVTGESGPDGHSDYVTIAYDP
jgi:WD40 repeat protein